MNRFGTMMLLAFAGAVALVACRNDPGPPPFRASRSVEIAKQACEINALAEEHDTLIQRVGSIERGAPVQVTDDRWTILMAKLRQYRAEIDATYRFVTANCNNYNLCMQAHDFAESECAQSREAWTDSHRRFNQLALDLAELEVPPHHPHHGKPKPCGPHCNLPPSDCHAVNCNVQGAVFTTGCCYDGD